VEPGADRRGTDRVRVATVLVVDDSSTVRRILRRDLEGAGYRVTEAADGEEGLASCRSDRPDLVLLDVDMPVLDGLATMEQMQLDPHLRWLPVLFLTARIAGSEVARGLDLGAHDYLKKPCDAAELIARVSTAMRLASRHDELQRRARELDALSNTDPLTGLGNRRHLAQVVEDMLARRGPLAVVGLVVVDIDHFKQVNDSQGHPVGDAVLATVAARMRRVTLPEETLVRWGGEEFVALAPDLDRGAVTDLAERLRLAVSATPMAVGTIETVSVTVSAGGAVGGLADMRDLVATADAALYEAKKAGRNRVVVADSASPREPL
jgi:two-component system cell cycle response regulator